MAAAASSGSSVDKQTLWIPYFKEGISSPFLISETLKDKIYQVTSDALKNLVSSKIGSEDIGNLIDRTIIQITTEGALEKDLAASFTKNSIFINDIINSYVRTDFLKVALQNKNIEAIIQIIENTPIDQLSSSIAPKLFATLFEMRAFDDIQKIIDHCKKNEGIYGSAIMEAIDLLLDNDRSIETVELIKNIFHSKIFNIIPQRGSSGLEGLVNCLLRKNIGLFIDFLTNHRFKEINDAKIINIKNIIEMLSQKATDEEIEKVSETLFKVDRDLFLSYFQECLIEYPETALKILNELTKKNEAILADFPKSGNIGLGAILQLAMRYRYKDLLNKLISDERLLSISQDRFALIIEDYLIGRINFEEISSLFKELCNRNLPFLISVLISKLPRINTPEIQERFLKLCFEKTSLEYKELFFLQILKQDKFNKIFSKILRDDNFLEFMKKSSNSSLFSIIKEYISHHPEEIEDISNFFNLLHPSIMLDTDSFPNRFKRVFEFISNYIKDNKASPYLRANICKFEQSLIEIFYNKINDKELLLFTLAAYCKDILLKIINDPRFLDCSEKLSDKVLYTLIAYFNDENNDFFKDFMSSLIKIPKIKAILKNPDFSVLCHDTYLFEFILMRMADLKIKI